jgi:hypothetical protein
MTSIVMPRRPLLRVGALLGAMMSAVVLVATSAWANPCSKTGYGTVPNCQAQAQAGISYSGWETKGWAYYCSGDHPYYWRPYNEANNSCFSVAENKIDEGTNYSKFSATITNWCFNKQTIVITLACSTDKPVYVCANSMAPHCPFGR